MYWIALTGTQSSGKTTLMKALVEPLNSYADQKGFRIDFQEERARTVFREEFAQLYPDFNTLMSTDPLSFQLRLSEVFVEDACAARNRDVLVISDRVGLDVLVYTLMATHRNFRDEQKVSRIFDNLRKTMMRVDHLFMTTPLPETERDGFRPDCYEGEMRFLEKELFSTLSVPYRPTMLPSDHNERINLVLSTIKGFYP